MRLILSSAILSAISLVLATSASALVTAPAPAGPAMSVAATVIHWAGHPCPRVVSARRDSSGGIHAFCSNNETYLVFRVVGVAHTVAMRCSAAASIGVSC
jgi:hypothetical protein